MRKEKLLLKFIAKFFSVYGENMAKWCREFEAGRNDVHDEIRRGRPSVVDDEIIQKIDRNHSC
jgi:transposase